MALELTLVLQTRYSFARGVKSALIAVTINGSAWSLCVGVRVGAVKVCLRVIVAEGGRFTQVARTSGMHRNAIAIASSSAVYGFWSSRETSVTEYLSTILSVWRGDLCATIPPMPTRPPLSEALVAMTMSLAFFAAVVAASRFFCGDTYLRLVDTLRAASGCVFGNVLMLTYVRIPARACRSHTVWMPASASTTAVATVRKALVMAHAPIF
ncbi:hypothetical protein Forpe1208_v016179 [Fusarium oxysporum f. sp. rapae]|uniref:Uncharacterized protein n=1 Tax=Fusarium oxysporum f. sp. rapae TaxID=485398 RepID=A0A8J5NGA4_FUSOX|nr:hypothetical protein Forpe1208_v016179 [Fusarium oxysporum f. sp. rapae]